MRFNKDNITFNFLHNPRTGGRWVAEILINNGYVCWDAPFVNTLYTGDNSFTEIIHLNLEQSQNVYDKMPMFTVVRHPVQRFMSALQVASIPVQELESYERFLWYMEQCEFNFKVKVNGLVNIPNRWFKPQHEWYSSNISVWRFEQGLGKNFAEWLDRKMGIKIVETVEKSQPRVYNISDKLRSNIEKYYAKDMELYNDNA